MNQRMRASTVCDIVSSENIKRKKERRKGWYKWVEQRKMAALGGARREDWGTNVIKIHYTKLSKN